MLVNPAVLLDANMTVADTLARLASHGYWLNGKHPSVEPIIAEVARNLQIDFSDAESRLRRPVSLIGAAIRRQWYANIMWYPRPLYYVLGACYQAASDSTLLDALNLHEPDSRPPIVLEPDGSVPSREGVVFDGGQPIAVSLENWGAGPRLGLAGGDPAAEALPEATSEENLEAGEFESMITDNSGGGSTAEVQEPKTRDLHAWPRINAPNYSPADHPFDVEVGLTSAQQTGVLGGEVVIVAPQGAATIDVTVDLIADGIDALDGWSKTLHLSTNDLTAGSVKFRLVGRSPSGPEPVQLTTIEVRYLYGGTVCGTAWRPIVIGASDAATLNLPDSYGVHWLSQPATASTVSLQPDPQTPDLTIEISKPDANPITGSYICRVCSPHPISGSRGPFRIELGNDAQGFAKQLVTLVRTYRHKPILDDFLEARGRLIADKLGTGVLAALREVAKSVGPAVPSVLIRSAEPFVPWELAALDPPLDPSRPPFLGAQVVVGRWLRDPASTDSNPVSAASERPPIQPPSAIKVKHMAVMAGVYQMATGLKKLPNAEAEAEELTTKFHALPLEASLEGIKQLIRAKIEYKSEPIGGVEAVHFAGHGNYDPTEPDSSVLYLSDGMPLDSSVFRNAKYGGECQPVMFLNACMIGIGGELLGDMGGFPGNCLKGGFGGVLGALWEVDDSVARDLALEFWRRALSKDGTPPESVGSILRDLRARYSVTPAAKSEATYLAYVYYGHPQLTLHAVR